MRGSWTPSRAAAIAVGGAAGAGVRWAALGALGSPTFPWPVLLLNVVGSVVLGALLAEEWAHPASRLVLHDAGAIGFCGGLTTFSTFAVEVVELVRDGRGEAAALYVVVSVSGAVGGVVAGALALGRVRALQLPVEEEP